jgi:hypothetical protein
MVLVAVLGAGTVMKTMAVLDAVVALEVVLDALKALKRSKKLAHLLHGSPSNDGRQPKTNG